MPGSLAKTRSGLPDGLKLDTEGNLFATGPGGVLILTPHGMHLGTILNRAGHRELRVRGRRPRAVHHGPHVCDARPAESERARLLSSRQKVDET